MTDHSIKTIPAGTPLPADDPNRSLTVSSPADPALPCVAQAGNIYTVLVSGAQTEGRYCLIDMLVPDGGGLPAHRHDLEELFTLLKGELEFTFRGQAQTVRAPASVDIPASAPHRFANASGSTVHMLCMCTPAGQDDFFLAVGDPVLDRQATPPALDDAAKAEKKALMQKLAPSYRLEFLPQD